MKQLNPSYFLYCAGILLLLITIINDEIKWGYALGSAFIILGIAMRIKHSLLENSDEHSPLIDEEKE